MNATLDTLSRTIARSAGPRPLVVAFTAISAVIIAASYGAVRSNARAVERGAAARMQSTAQLQRQLIERNVKERLEDAQLLASNPVVWDVLESAARRRARSADERKLETLVAQVRATYDYKLVSIADSRGLSIYPADRLFALDEQRLAKRVMRSGKPAVAPLRIDASGGLEYGVFHPVFARGVSTRPVVGVVYLVHDGVKQLLPLLSQVRGEYEGVESVLGQLEGDSMAVVAASATGKGLAPLKTRVPLSDQSKVATRLLMTGDNTVATGADYRDTAVLAAADRIPGTPWIVVAKVELSSLARDGRTFTFFAVATAIALILLTAVVLRLLWLMAQRTATERHFALASRYLAATTSSIDGFLIIDRKGQVLECNAALEQMTGFAKKELLKRSLHDLKVDIPVQEVDPWLTHLFSRPSARFQSQWRRKNGALLDIDVSTSALPAVEGSQLFCFVRDITEQIATRTRLERLNSTYFFLNRASEALFAANGTQEAFEVACKIATEEGHFQLAWVGTVDEAEGVVRPVAWDGTASQYAREEQATTDPALPTSQGPTGRAFREGRQVIVNDFAHSEETAPWHALAAEQGIAAAAAFPVLVDGRAVAVVCLYSSRVGFFDAELVGALSELSRLLGLVVQSATAEESRREAEKRLRQSEEQFQLLFEASPMPMIVRTEQGGRISRVNRAFIELFGYAREDIPTTDTQREAFYPDPAYRAEVQALFQRLVRGSREGGMVVDSPELRVRCKDGTFRFVRGFVSHAGGEIILGYVDLTALRASQDMLQEAEEIARLGSWSHDLRSNVIQTSHDFLRILGFEKGVLQQAPDDGTPWLMNMFHASERERLVSKFRQMEPEYDDVVRAATTDGTTRYLRVRVRVERDASGVPVRAIGSFQDVTTEVTATRELQQYRDHLQELVDERTAELAKVNATLQLTDQRLKAVLAMSQTAATLDEASILQLGVDEAAKLTGSTVGYVHLLSEDEQQIEVGTWSTGTRQLCGCENLAHYPVERAGIWADAVHRREPVLHNDFAAAAPRRVLPAGHVALERHLVVPVFEGVRVRMLLGVGNKPAQYDIADVQELQLIGHDIWSIVQRRRTDFALEQAYARVKASDERFALAMAASSEGIWEWEIGSSAIKFNDICASMLGYAVGEMPLNVMRWQALLHADDRARVPASMNRAVRSDEPFSLEFRMRAQDGSYRWINLRGRVVARAVDGRATRAVGTQTDLTARREAEDALRAAVEQADAANRAKSSFLAVMSHEIRTPLNGVIAMAEILSHSTLPPTELDAVQTIQTSAHALLAVIDDILDFSKIEAGRLELNLADESLLQVVENLCESLFPVSQARNVNLHLFVEPTVPRLVQCDATRVRQILYNITGNAIKFSAGRADVRGRVSVRVETIASSPHALAFRIADNGIGMSDETIGRLFNSFTQGEESTTRRFGGTGLGLAITKRLVELMDGSITVTSTPDVGSNFLVILPLTVADGAPSLTPHDLSGVHCVVVQNEQVVPTDDLRRLLEFAGARVSIVADDLAGAAVASGAADTCVVVHAMRGDRLALPDAYASIPHLHHVALATGNRRREHERLQLPDVVMLDHDILRARRFIRAVAVAAGRASPEIFPGASAAAPTTARAAPVTVEQARAEGSLILVAEDDRTNQKVILQQLGLLGHAAEVAENGVQALIMWRTRRYALLLTDLHMPEMDGYELTQAIRAEEKPGQRMPIVALTANALRGESVRATAAGMDGYLTKPVPLEMLREMVDRYIVSRATPILAPPPVVPARAAAPTQQAAHSVLNVSVLAGLVGDDAAVIREFLGDYVQSARSLVDEMRQAEAAGDLARVVFVVHKLKSSSRSVGALPLGALCADIEAAGKAADASTVAALRVPFDDMVAQVFAAIDQYLAQPDSVSSSTPHRP